MPTAQTTQNSSTGSTAASVVPSSAPQLLQELSNRARAIVGSVTQTNLMPYTPSGMGNMPYYWTDPNNTLFNQQSYAWIGSGVGARTSATDPVGLANQAFTTIYGQVINSISYSLSQADTVQLNQDSANATDQQGALLTAWKQAFNIPATTAVSINDVLNTIMTKWSTKPNTTLMDINNARDLTTLLGNAPPAGQTILPLLGNYLGALGSSISLQNAATYARGMKQDVLNALNSPSADNGAIPLDTTGSALYPAYTFTTSTADILNGLKASSNALTITMNVSQADSSNARVSIQGGAGASFLVPFAEFIGISVGGSADYFSNNIMANSSSVQVTMTFTGVTLVTFGPMPYDSVQRTGWYWLDPITNAINNTGKDVTGWKFSPNPGIDFSSKGTFGLLTGAVISNFPTLSISVQGSQSANLEKSFSQQSNWNVSFLGIPLTGGTQSYYQSSTSQSSSGGGITVTLAPPPQVIASNRVDARGWVLGVQAVYPGATS